MRLTLLIVIQVLLIGCTDRASECRELVAKIRNDSIRWDGSYVGLRVSGMGEVEQRVLDSGAACRPFLIAALDDDSRFVAAHVLLTQMQVDGTTISATEWNHLRVTLRPDGRVEIPNGQRVMIRSLWTQK